MSWEGWGRGNEAGRIARSLWVIQIKEDGSLVYSGDARDGEMEFGRYLGTESIWSPSRNERKGENHGWLQGFYLGTG